MHVYEEQRRAVVDLALGMAIAFLLLLLNLTTNFLDRIYRYIESYSRHDPSHWIANLVFFWLIALLWLAFGRWRTASLRREELENIVSSISPDALLVVTPDRTITFCNQSVTRLFGYAPRELLGQKTDMIYFDRRSSTAQSHEVYETLERDGFHVGQATGVRKGGEKMPLEIIAGDLSGRQGAVLLLRDIRERVRAAEEQQKLEARMWRRQKLESLGVLSSGIAHDFNNLLMAILGNADLISLELPPDAPFQERLEGIKSAAKCASDLCDQILSYSGKGALVFKPVNLSELVREIGDLLAVSVPRKAKLSYDLEPDPPLVHADPTQLRQVVMNLITNAAESLGDEGGSIMLSTGVMPCNADYLRGTYLDEELESGDYVFLCVADTGCGIDQETRARIFDPFFTTKFSGRGLGLAAVLGIVRSHQGALKVESELGRGTTFTILFPMDKARAQREANGSTGEPGARVGAGDAAEGDAGPERRTVLLADDDPMVLDVARMMLEQIGYEVVTARDGEEAVQRFKERIDTISVCLLDVKMPAMSGDEAARAMLQLRQDARIILTSGYAEEQYASAKPLDGCGFIHKPYELHSLRAQIRAALES